MDNLVVGVDGTELSMRGLEWAADTVGSAGRLFVLLGMHPWTESLVEVETGDEVTYEQALDRDVVGEWTADVADRVDQLSTSVTEDSTHEALDEAATTVDADAIVVGSHVTKRGFPKRIGRLTNQLMRTTVHPVIVVPPGQCVRLDEGPIVVAIGHGNATRGAVRWAAALAEERRLSVELLHATGDAPVFQADGLLDLTRYQMHPEDRADWSQGKVLDFAELMQTMTRAELDIAVSTPQGLAALRLDEVSERSSLLVIGRHRSMLDRGYHTAQPLRHALTHARCPVAVIADRPDRDLGPPDGV